VRAPCRNGRSEVSLGPWLVGWSALVPGAPTLTYPTSVLVRVIWRRSGCCGRRAGRHARRGVTPEASAIAVSASGPALRRFQRLTAGLACEGWQCTSFGYGRGAFRLGASWYAAAGHGQRRSSSLRCGRSTLTARTPRQVRPLSGKACDFARPAVGIVGGLVPDHGVSDPAGPIGHRAADDAAMLAPSLERGRVGTA